MSIVADEVRLALTAIQYLTRLPVPRSIGHSEARLNAAARYFPLAGIVVGLGSSTVFLAAHNVLPHPVAVLLAMGAGVLVTGGFHEDGLADACDGFGGGWEKAQILAIMKDSHIGAYGVLGLVFVLALKFFALSALPAAQFLVITVAAHAFSRFMAVSVVCTQRYVRDDATARAAHTVEGMSPGALAWAAIFALAPLAWLGTAGLAGAGGALAARFLLARYFYRRIGGYTGDCLGAIQQVAEIAFYLVLLAWTST